MPKMKRTAFTRNKIKSRAMTVFRKKGYNKTRIRDIADAYGCEPSNFYNFFKSKEEIIFEILNDEMESILYPVRSVAKDVDSSPATQLKMIFESHAKVILSKKRCSAALAGVNIENLDKKSQRVIIAKRDEYDKILRLVIRRGIHSGFFKDTEVKLVSFAITSIIDRAQVWYRHAGDKPVDEVIDTLFLFALKMLDYEKPKNKKN